MYTPAREVSVSKMFLPIPQPLYKCDLKGMIFLPILQANKDRVTKIISQFFLFFFKMANNEPRGMPFHYMIILSRQLIIPCIFYPLLHAPAQTVPLYKSIR